MPNKYSEDVVQRMITMVNEELTQPLTAWEAQFVESVTDQWERTHRLSQAQIDKLEQIYADKTD